MANRLGRIQTLWAHIDTVLNAVAAELTKRIIQLGEPVLRRRITTVGKESVGLQQTGGANKFIGIPPE